MDPIDFQVDPETGQAKRIDMGRTLFGLNAQTAVLCVNITRPQIGSKATKGVIQIKEDNKGRRLH